MPQTNQRSQTFEWMSTRAPGSPAGAAAFAGQFERFARERARLLFNLAFPVEAAIGRIDAALRWELDSTVWPRQAPAFLAEVPRWVREVYAQMTPGKG